jgi:hypothetical protein
MTNSGHFQGPPSFNPTQPRPQQPFERRREQPLAHQQRQRHSQQPSKHQHSPQESPPKLQQRKGKAEKLDCLDKRLLDLPLVNRFDQRSHNQTAWINVVTPTDRQAKPDAADKIQRTQRDVCQLFIQPATPRPPAEPDPASRPLVKQAAPRPPAEPVPAPRPPVKHARAISDVFIQPAAPRPPTEPDPAPRPLRSKLHLAPLRSMPMHCNQLPNLETASRPIPRLRDG